jgi:hypothetical protein
LISTDLKKAFIGKEISQNRLANYWSLDKLEINQMKLYLPVK